MTRYSGSALSMLLAVSCVTTQTTAVGAFQVAPIASSRRELRPTWSSSPSRTCLGAATSEDDKVAAATKTDSAYVPPAAASPDADEKKDEGDDDQEILAKVEKLGRGAAKEKRRGKRKGSSVKSSSSKPKKSTLAPEVVYYEGPPAITETIAPTISILTVVGIIPAAAAWARQAWVRYKITNRRIRVTSGIGGKEMAEIVYNDIVEIRTAKRLFGDGDMVAFLRDGAKFEMRNIPDFEDAMEFILQHVDDDVVKQYKEKGEVTKP